MINTIDYFLFSFRVCSFLNMIITLLLICVLDLRRSVLFIERTVYGLHMLKCCGLLIKLTACIIGKIGCRLNTFSLAFVHVIVAILKLKLFYIHITLRAALYKIIIVPEAGLYYPIIQLKFIYYFAFVVIEFIVYTLFNIKEIVN